LSDSTASFGSSIGASVVEDAVGALKPMRAFPELPGHHPLHWLPMTLEHGATWLDCAFASDCCCVVNGRPHFLHGAYVQPESEFFEGLLRRHELSQAQRYAQPLDGLPFPETFAGIIVWMYTRETDVLFSNCLFEVYQTARYLGMKEAFLDLIHEQIVSNWCKYHNESLLLASAMQSRGLPLEAVMRVFHDSEVHGCPILGNLRLRILLHWARCFEHVDKAERSALQKVVSTVLPSCTAEGIQVARSSSEGAFDAIIRPSALWDLGILSNASSDMFKFHCTRCNMLFQSPAQIDANRCRVIQVRHSPITFESRAGNTCCNSCRRPTHTLGCITCYDEHEIVSGDCTLAIMKLEGKRKTA